MKFFVILSIGLTATFASASFPRSDGENHGDEECPSSAEQIPIDKNIKLSDIKDTISKYGDPESIELLLILEKKLKCAYSRKNNPGKNAIVCNFQNKTYTPNYTK